MINLFVIQKQSIKLWQLKVSLNNILKQVKGYEDGLVIDDSGVAENFMNTIANYYKTFN
jgi:hypothetical protein